MAEHTPTTGREPRRPARARRIAPLPEWMTERWKHRVEAEARGRLKREVQDVGSHRPPARP